MAIVYKNKEIKCKNCGSSNVNAFSRIVGYFSNLMSWSPSKISELRARKKGNYKI